MCQIDGPDQDQCSRIVLCSLKRLAEKSGGADKRLPGEVAETGILPDFLQPRLEIRLRGYGLRCAGCRPDLPGKDRTGRQALNQHKNGSKFRHH